MDHGLRVSLRWWLKFLGNARPRVVALAPIGPPLLLFPDGFCEGEGDEVTAGIGAVLSSALSRQPVVSAHAMKARSMASATAAGATTGKSSKKLSVGTPKHLFRQVLNAAAARLNPTTLAPEPKGSAWAL